MVFAPYIAPYDPMAQDLLNRRQPPSLEHLMGTDHLGRDVFSRVLYGARPPMLVGALAVVLAVTIGSIAGMLAGYKGGWVDSLLSRAADVQMSIPALILALLILALFGSSITNVIIVIALEFWPMHFRVVRTKVQGMRNMAYINIAELFGMSDAKILFRHVAPSVIPLLYVTASYNFVGAVLAEVGLSFLGLGMPPGTPDWGVMISEGQTYLATTWWAVFGPGIPLVLLLWSVQNLGDWGAQYAHKGGDIVE